MFKILKISMVMLCIVIMTQCSEGPFGRDFGNPDHKDTRVSGNGPGGDNENDGNGHGGQNSGQVGSEGLYGDLVICLRTEDGIPAYYPILGEHGLTYYPQPIKIDLLTGEPLIIDGVYQTFSLNEEGEPILDDDVYVVEEVDFGRLNLVRSPQSVLDQALAEAIKGLTQPGVIDIQTDASGRLIAIIGQEDWLINYDNDTLNDEFNDKTIDSPRENMAIYQELLSNGLDGQLAFLSDYGFSAEDILDLSFSSVAAGSDKTGKLLLDELAYMNDWIIHWDGSAVNELPNSPDVKNRRYFDYTSFSYSRSATYGNKFVRITKLHSNDTWEQTYRSLLEVVPWTDPAQKIVYDNGSSTNISGYANAADDAVQVLEFIHSSDLIQYSPYFTASGLNTN